MRGREAKDFLVQQTAEQAAVDNVPLSNIEKRMRYFTETCECPEASRQKMLSKRTTQPGRKKISLLMARAYRRIERENPANCGYGMTRSAFSAETITSSYYSGGRTRLYDPSEWCQHIFSAF
jgi:hypothetical protein